MFCATTTTTATATTTSTAIATPTPTMTGGSTADPSDPPAISSSALFSVYLRLRPPCQPRHGPLPPSIAPASNLYPTLPPERFLTVESADTSNAPYSALRNSPDSNSRSDSKRPYDSHPHHSNNPTHITLQPPRDTRKRAVEKFAFTRVFDEAASQLDVYQGVGLADLINGVVRQGRDGLLATLGVTGSGKSHTILGSKSHRGLTQLALEAVFQTLESRLPGPDDLRQAARLGEIAATDPSEARIWSARRFLDSLAAESRGSRAGTPLTDLNNLSSTPRRPATQHNAKAFPTSPTLPSITAPALEEGAEYAVVLSLYEVHNDRIFDLLAESVPTTSNYPSTRSHATLGSLSSAAGKADMRGRRPLLFKATEATAREGRKVVAGLRKVICSRYEEAIAVLEAGLATRRVTGTVSNSVSSRSHGFMCIEVKRRTSPKGGLIGRWEGAQLTIVDLAGSERARQAKTAGATLAEAGKINESLMYLGQCLQMQSDASAESSKPAIVPFRQCKLTELLFSNSFPSHAQSNHHRHPPQRAVMIVTADPLGDFNATSQILRYAALAREVTVPRIPSVASMVFDGPPPVSHETPRSPSKAASVASAMTCGSSAATGQTRSGTIRHYEDSRLSERHQQLQDELEILALRLAEERVRRREAEDGWRRAEEQAETLERDVREECLKEVELRVEMDRRRWFNALGDAADRSEAHWDRKVEILAQGINIHEDAPSDSHRITQLETENEELRRQLAQLQRIQQLSSPTKASSRSVKAQSRSSQQMSGNIQVSAMSCQENVSSNKDMHKDENDVIDLTAPSAPPSRTPSRKMRKLTSRSQLASPNWMVNEHSDDMWAID